MAKHNRDCWDWIYRLTFTKDAKAEVGYNYRCLVHCVRGVLIAEARDEKALEDIVTQAAIKEVTK